MKKFRIVAIACMAVVMLSLFLVGVSGAWFTNSASRVTNNQTASVSLQILQGSSAMTSNDISIASAEDISIKNTSNINVYIRAKIIINCVDSTTGEILTNLNPSDYVTITTSNLASVSGYDSSFKYYYDTTNSEFLYLAPNASVKIVDAEDIVRVASTPANVEIKFSVFAEAIQRDDTSFGLSKWSV